MRRILCEPFVVFLVYQIFQIKKAFKQIFTFFVSATYYLKSGLNKNKVNFFLNNCMKTS